MNFAQFPVVLLLELRLLQKWFTFVVYIIPVSAHNSPRKFVPLLFSWYSEGNRGSGRLGSLPITSELRRGGTETWTHFFLTVRRCAINHPLIQPLQVQTPRSLLSRLCEREQCRRTPAHCKCIMNGSGAAPRFSEPEVFFPSENGSKSRPPGQY